MDQTVTSSAAQLSPPLASAAAEDATTSRLKKLPPSVGMILVAAGVAIMPLPGPFGTPLVLAGGLVLAPTTFGKINDWTRRRFPRARQFGMQVVERFLNDLEKRYPPDGTLKS